MSATKKASKTNIEDLQNALQNLITQGKKDGMIRASDLNAILEKMQLTAEKIEEIYDRFEAMNIQIIGAELELDDDLDLLPLDLGCPAIAVFTVCEAVVYWQKKRVWSYLMIAGAVISTAIFSLELAL